MGSLCGANVNANVNANADKKPPTGDIFNKLALEFPCRNALSHCLATKRIAKILIEFSKFKNDPKSLPYKTIHEYINQLSTEYTNRKLLNDYIHLVTKHKTNEDYEAIHNFLIKEMNYKCDVITCSNIIRNQRDRSNDNDINIQQQLYDTSDPKEVNIQQLCDKIHCYFLHTFDLGYRLTENEREKVKTPDDKIIVPDTHNTDNTDSIDDTDSTDEILLKNCIDNELLRRQEIIHHKQERLASIESSKDSKQESISVSSSSSKNSAQNRNNKWILNRNEYTSHRSFRTLNHDPNDYKKEEIYSYGFRFRYGKYHKNDAWFIPFKHQNFKSELTQNNINQLSIDQFNGWFDKASDHLESDHCKSMQLYYMSDSISVNHLLSIIIYCGADELQRSLTQTYRKRKKTETNEDLINRHSEYGHWGGLLFETANNFGVEVKKGSHEKFYHGIDHQMTFESTIAYFHGPLSTSSEYEVALVFANQTGNHGLIIELHNLDASHAAYFDCQWCSEFAWESEQFFIGGDEGLIIRNIIAPISAQNYEIYIEGLNIIQQMMRGNQYKHTKGLPIPRHVKKCVTKLLKHELYKQSNEINYKIYKNLPIYIEKSLHYYCLNVQEISIDWRTLHQKNENKESKGYRFTKNIFVSKEYNSSFLDLNSLCLLFPNMHKITISNLRLNRSAMESLSKYFQQLQLNNKNIIPDEKNDDNNNNKTKSKLNDIIIYRPIKDTGFEDQPNPNVSIKNDIKKKPPIKNGKHSKTNSTINMAINEYSDVFCKYGWALDKKAKFELEITKIQ